jgi:hypothetical protein
MGRLEERRNMEGKLAALTMVRDVKAAKRVAENFMVGILGGVECGVFCWRETDGWWMLLCRLPEADTKVVIRPSKSE